MESENSCFARSSRSLRCADATSRRCSSVVGSGPAGLDVLAVNRRRLLVSEQLLGCISRGDVADGAVSAMVAYSFGQLPARSQFITAVELFTTPWLFVSGIAAGFSARLGCFPLFRFAWLVRPVVFGLGALDAVQHGRWGAADLVVLLAVLTYTTGRFERAWDRALQRLGDQRVIDEHLDPDDFPVQAQVGAARRPTVEGGVR